MESDRIERQYQDSKDLVAYLMGKGEVSFATYIEKSLYYRLQVILRVSFQNAFQLMRQRRAALTSE